MHKNLHRQIYVVNIATYFTIEIYASAFHWGIKFFLISVKVGHGVGCKMTHHSVLIDSFPHQFNFYTRKRSCSISSRVLSLHIVTLFSFINAIQNWVLCLHFTDWTFILCMHLPHNVCFSPVLYFFFRSSLNIFLPCFCKLYFNLYE